jgi:hypothetical protein
VIARGPGDEDTRRVAEPEPAPSGRALPPVVSRRALDLVAAFGLAQRNVTLTMSDPALAGQVAAAKTEQVRAYHALLAYVAALEGGEGVTEG